MYRRMTVKILYPIVTLFCFNPGISCAAGSLETVFFLSDDLKTATEYKNSRYDKVYSANSMNFPINFNKNSIMYARPANYTWRTEFFNGADHNQLTFFNTSNYAYLQKHHESSDFLVTTGKNQYKLVVDGGRCLGEECYLAEAIISVVFPKKFKIVNYSANVKGNWVIVDNTYSFYSENIEGPLATFELEDTVPKVYVDLGKELSEFSDIKVSYDGHNVHVVMPIEGVFRSGDATIQKKGEKWIKIFGETMKNAGFKELRVEGHSDSTPIKSKVFPSNWELSSARSASVVRYLVKQGIDSRRLASVGYAESRPVAGNKTPEGRRKNRRIEFTIVPDQLMSAQ